MATINKSIGNLNVNAEKTGEVDEKVIKRAVVKIKVFGVGGGGGNVLKRLAETALNDVELIAVNTDAHALSLLNVGNIKEIQIGSNMTNGHGTGGRFDIAEQAARRDADRLKNMIEGADIIFITAGMGGGTGTGAAPVIAEIAKKLGVLTVGVVTFPFGFEGNRKQKIANEGIAKLRANMDALVIVQNDNLLKLPENKSLSFVNAFKAVDFVLLQAIRCIAELILTTGFINVDFADVTTIFQQSTSSDAILGMGQSNISAVKAVQNALESPLIDRSLECARGMILNITGDENLSLDDVNEAADYIFSKTEGEINIIFGIVIDKKMKGVIQAMLIATDFTDSIEQKAQNISKMQFNAPPVQNNQNFNAPTVQNYQTNNAPPVQNQPQISTPPNNIIPIFNFNQYQKND
jgi:cell division protein FtsZ